MSDYSKEIEELDAKIAELKRVKRVKRSRLNFAIAAEAEAFDRREADELLAAFRADGVKSGEAVATYHKLRQASLDNHHPKILIPLDSRSGVATGISDSSDFPGVAFDGGIERGSSPVRTVPVKRVLGARPV